MSLCNKKNFIEPFIIILQSFRYILKTSRQILVSDSQSISLTKHTNQIINISLDIFHLDVEKKNNFAIWWQTGGFAAIGKLAQYEFYKN